MSNAARVCQTSVLRSNMNVTKDAFDLKLWEKILIRCEGRKYNFRYMLFPKYIMNVTKEALT